MILEKAPSEVADLVDDVMAEFHPELVKYRIRVDALMALPAEDSAGGALKLHGYPCAAVIKKTTPDVRLTGGPDALLKIDAAEWQSADEARRRALIDHELQHLEVARDREGNVKTDDAARPVLKLRLHDHQLGLFLAVLRRHGAASYEHLHIDRLQRDLEQRELPFMAASPEAEARVIIERLDAPAEVKAQLQADLDRAFHGDAPPADTPRRKRAGGKAAAGARP